MPARPICKAGHQLGEPGLLFEKIEDASVESQLAKLRQTREGNQLVKPAVKPQKDSISYGDFGRMDIRIGTILEAVNVPRTKKLMQLKIDTGMDVRTVVSGIAEYFDPVKIWQAGVPAGNWTGNQGYTFAGHDPAGEDAGGKLVFVIPEEGSREWCRG
jgi:methionyl-tRNA synthetase